MILKNDYKSIYAVIVHCNMVPKKENYIWSKSPYSVSFYYHHKDEKITWGNKPQESYRVSDHWNWETDDEIHCPVIEKRYLSNFMARKVNENGLYEPIN